MTLTKATSFSWLLVEGYGTGDSVLDWGKQRASFFIGVLFSAIRVLPDYSALAASAAEANRFATVISAGNANYSFKGSDCGPILHSVLGEVKISERALDATTLWLKQCVAALPSKRKRAETAARWINQATLHSEHVRFLFFFFAIDALFGVRFEVERSIVTGVQSCMPGSWSQRCEWLFDLRSELVHGGSASFKEWHRYEKYSSHFQSEPMQDVEEIAATCLMRFLALSTA
jgi:Apea-like HEPN